MNSVYLEIAQENLMIKKVIKNVETFKFKKEFH